MIKKFLSSKKPEERSDVPQLSIALRDAIKNALGRTGLPTMPNSAARAFQLATNPEASLVDFKELIESDEALSARVLKIANSVYFQRATPSKTIEESINNIGLNELRSLLNANSLPDLLPSKHPARPSIWANDVATAIFSKMIAKNCLPDEANAAFLAGLMHDIGKLLLLQRLDGDYNVVLQSIRSDGKPFCQAEEDQFAFNHCEIGQVLGEHWNFSPEIITVIREHHLPWEELTKDSTTPTLTMIVKSADTIAHALGIGHQHGFSDFRERMEEALDPALEAIGINPDGKKDLLFRFQREYDSEFDLYNGL